MSAKISQNMVMNKEAKQHVQRLESQIQTLQEDRNELLNALMTLADEYQYMVEHDHHWEAAMNVVYKMEG